MDTSRGETWWLAFRSTMRRIADGLAFITDCRTRTRRGACKMCVNRAVYIGRLLVATLTGTPPPDVTTMVTYPFRLSHVVRWSQSLPGWYVIEDAASLSCMEKLRREPEELLLNRLTMGMVLLDIGAHQGRYALSARPRIGPPGRVIAVEAHPQNAALLRRNLAENGMHSSIVVNAACWSADQPLYLNASALSTHTSVAMQQTSRIKPVPTLVAGVKVDTLVARLNVTRLNAIKIDVEGGELDVLIGAEATLATFGPCLFIEFHHTLPDLRAWLRERRYQIVAIVYDQVYNQEQAGLGWLLAIRKVETTNDPDT